MNRKLILIRAATVAAVLALCTSSARAQEGSPGDSAAATFQAGREDLRAGRLTEAVAKFETLLTEHRDSDVAPYAAELLLDSLNRQQDYGRMAAWVERLLADSQFLAAAPDLAERLRRLERQIGRKRAEVFEQAGDHEGCARAYLELYTRAPRADDADEILYNAGVCYGAAGLPGRAAATLERLVAEQPQSALARRALLSLAQISHRLAHFDRAANAYERYARRYPGEKYAPDALADALRLRQAMGQPEAARALADLHARHYGRRRPRQSAQLSYAAIAGEEALPRKAAAELEAFLQRWSKTAPRELVLAANARLGALLWKQSCPRTDDSTGACVRTVAVSGKNRCRPGRVHRLRKRNSRLAARARKALERAVALCETLPPLPAEVMAKVHQARAQALFTLAEQDYEGYLALGFPTGLSFDSERPRAKAESTRRLVEWFEKTQQHHAKLASTYGELAKVSRAWAAATAMRRAQLDLALSDSLRAAKIPLDVRSGEYATDKRKAFCDELGRMWEPMDETGKEVLQHCVWLPFDSRWTPHCLHELETRWPKEFPPLREIHEVAVLAPVTELTPLAIRAP